MAERVWDRFLTEQDKATLVGKADRRIGFGDRPALLLIDLYRWVFGDKPESNLPRGFLKVAQLKHDGDRQSDDE